MDGLLNSQQNQTSQAAPMAADSVNPNSALEQIETQIESKTKDANVLSRIVTSGLRILFSQQTHGQVMAQVDNADNPLKGASEGIVLLMGIMMKESRNTMPPEEAMLASVVLLCKLLGFMEQRGTVQLTSESIGETVKSMFNFMLEKAGIDDDKIQSMVGKTGEDVQQNPDILKQMKGE